MTGSDGQSARGTGGATAGRHLIGVPFALVVAAALLVSVVLAARAAHGLGYEPRAARATTGANITLSTFPDSMVCHGSDGGSHPDWVTYCPSTTIRVPAYSTVTVTVLQYDGATPLHNSFFDRVRGTVGATMTVNGRVMAQLSASAAAHTFTIQTPPDAHEPYMFVSVPLMGTADSAPRVTVDGHRYPKPNVIVFRFRTGAPGTYVWHCYIPCGTGLAGQGFAGQEGFGGPMATTGYMAGTLTVS